MADFYKMTHYSQYPKDIAFSTSYYIPRKSRGEFDYVVTFGITGYIDEFLENNFFNIPKADILDQYKIVLDECLGENTYDIAHIEELYDLGYLPLRIRGIPEGERVPIGVPILEISNTVAGFAWLPLMLESVMQSELWHTMIAATVADQFKSIVCKYKTLTGGTKPESTYLGDFGFRGAESYHSAITTGAAWLTQFINTSCIPAIMWTKEHYKGVNYGSIGKGAVSTEHSCMCSNYAIDRNEMVHFKRLITEIYPNANFSCVCDSYDYVNFVTEIIPKCYNEIINHNGTIYIRGDSGDPVDVVTWTLQSLWNTFGGYTVLDNLGNEFKVLNDHIRVIYGDSITFDSIGKIYEWCYQNKFSIDNVVLGVGAFSFQAYIGNGKISPYTRDTVGVAVKMTNMIMNDSSEYPIYKQPIGDSSKKSPRGCIKIFKDAGKWMSEDCLVKHTYMEDSCKKTVDRYNANWLVTYFENGNRPYKPSMEEIRNKLNKLNRQ